MRKNIKYTYKDAQAALEYMLLLAVVVAVVLVGMQNYLPRVERASEIYFNETANIIMGRDPVGVCLNGGWTAWSACDAACDGGTQTRTCTNPPPTPACGLPCGPDDDGNLGSRACNTFPCSPVDCIWDPWSLCPACVNPGQQPIRTRLCVCPPPPTPVGLYCVGNAAEFCPFIPCLTPTCTWTPWEWGGVPGACSLACGGGVQTRTCSCPVGVPPGAYCPPDADGLNLSRACNIQGCNCLAAPATSATCGTTTIGPANDGATVTVACSSFNSACVGNLVYACANGAWQFQADTCGFACGDGTCDSATEDINNCCIDCGTGCNDGVCCAGTTPPEDRLNCPEDCAVCGDGNCDPPNEDLITCCDDCDTGCGDLNCCPNPPWNEDFTTCPADCTCPDCDTCCTDAGQLSGYCTGGACAPLEIDYGPVPGSCDIPNTCCCIPPPPPCDNTICNAQTDCTSCESNACCGWCDPLDPFNPTIGCCDIGNPPLGTCTSPPPPPPPPPPGVDTCDIDCVFSGAASGICRPSGSGCAFGEISIGGGSCIDPATEVCCCTPSSPPPPPPPGCSVLFCFGAVDCATDPFCPVCCDSNTNICTSTPSGPCLP